MRGNAQDAARRCELDRRIGQLHEVARLVANRAGVLELHAAKNHAAGWNMAASNKSRHAAELRRIATVLADHRVHRFISENEELCELLMGERPLGTQGANCLAQRRIDPPSSSNGTGGEAACR
jgi:hypothetical protein